jgi:nickel-type superoxide dismutase maturation protease
MDDGLKDINLREFLLWLLRRRRRFRVTGNSMLPLLNLGDEVLVDPKAYLHFRPHPDDIVVAQHPYRQNLRLIKRVTMVNDNGDCLLEGDNPLESTDSRTFGPVSVEKIMGRVTSRF